MKIGIVGAGAMGSLFGGRLSQSGQEVLLYDINREHVVAIQKEGLAIEDLASGRREVCHPAATTQAEDLGNVQFLVIFVKSAATEEVARQFFGISGGQTIAVTMQNGLGNEGILKKYFGRERTAAGVTSQGATFLAAGRIRHAGRGPTHLCMSDRNNEKLEAFVDALNRAGLETDLEANIDDLIWSKLIINVGINALTALTGLPNGRLLEFPDCKALMAELVAEAVTVAEKKGIGLTYADPLQMVCQVAEKTGSNRSSMLQDFDRRKPSEIDFINGAIVREAEELGLEVPVNRAVTRLVRTLDAVHLENSAG
ncbi:MAG: 2-dehydropantoate 2-reductase [Spirochaetaceae bacterium]|nr:MAG: 2-dehydropantoate 2-reductase [Spirochaetaceae bacterium]